MGLTPGNQSDADGSTLKCAAPGCRFQRHSELYLRTEFGPYCCGLCKETRSSQHGFRCQRVVYESRGLERTTLKRPRAIRHANDSVPEEKDEEEEERFAGRSMSSASE